MVQICIIQSVDMHIACVCSENECGKNHQNDELSD